MWVGFWPLYGPPDAQAETGRSQHRALLSVQKEKKIIIKFLIGPWVNCDNIDIPLIDVCFKSRPLSHHLRISSKRPWLRSVKYLLCVFVEAEVSVCYWSANAAWMRKSVVSMVCVCVCVHMSECIRMHSVCVIQSAFSCVFQCVWLAMCEDCSSVCLFPLLKCRCCNFRIFVKSCLFLLFWLSFFSPFWLASGWSQSDIPQERCLWKTLIIKQWICWRWD